MKNPLNIEQHLLNYPTSDLYLTDQDCEWLKNGVCFGLASTAALYYVEQQFSDFLDALTHINQRKSSLLARKVVKCCFFLQSQSIQIEVAGVIQQQQSLSNARLLGFIDIHSTYFELSRKALVQLMAELAEQLAQAAGIILSINSHAVALVFHQQQWWLVDSLQLNVIPYDSPAALIDSLFIEQDKLLAVCLVQKHSDAVSATAFVTPGHEYHYTPTKPWAHLNFGNGLKQKPGGGACQFKKDFNKWCNAQTSRGWYQYGALIICYDCCKKVSPGRLSSPISDDWHSLNSGSVMKQAQDGSKNNSSLQPPSNSNSSAVLYGHGVMNPAQVNGYSSHSSHSFSSERANTTPNPVVPLVHGVINPVQGDNNHNPHLLPLRPRSPISPPGANLERNYDQSNMVVGQREWLPNDNNNNNNSYNSYNSYNNNNNYNNNYNNDNPSFPAAQLHLFSEAFMKNMSLSSRALDPHSSRYLQPSVLVDSDNVLYSVGSNEKGELGTGDVNERRSDYAIVTIDNAPCVVTMIARSSSYTLIVTHTGKCYGTGSNHLYQLGLDEPTQYNAFTLIPLPFEPKNITKIACGKEHTLILTIDGKCYSAGNKKGSGHSNPRFTEVQIPNSKGTKIKQIACGSSSSFMLTTEGACYCSSLKINNPGFTLISNLPLGETVKQIFARYSQAYLFSSTGQCYSIDDKANVLAIQGLPNGFEVTDVALGYNHAFALNSDGDCYVYATNYCNQLGFGANCLKVDKFTKVSLGMRSNSLVKQVVCGMEHSVILGKDGCCYVSGSNEWGQLGFPRQVENCTFFTDVISDIECIVACGHSYTVLKTNEGKYIDSGTYDSNNPQFGKYKFSPAKGMN